MRDGRMDGQRRDRRCEHAVGRLTFTPALNSTATLPSPPASSDGVAPPITGTKAITGTAVNDAPVNSVPGFQATAQDTPLTFACEQRQFNFS